LAGLDDVDTTHGALEHDTTDARDMEKVYKMPIRRASDAQKTPISMARDQSQSMQDFALKYGEKDDYLNANRMINLDVVRQKNYKAIVANVNRKVLRRSSSAYRLEFDETRDLSKTVKTERQTGGFTPRMTGGFGQTAPSTLPVLKNFARSLSKQKNTSIDDNSTQPTETLRILAGGLTKKNTQDNFSKQGTQEKFNQTHNTLKSLAETIGKKTHFAK